MKKEKSKDKSVKEKAEHIERSAIDIINDLADKAMEFTSEKLEQLEDKLQN